MKKSYLFFLGMSALLLTFGLALAGCGDDPVTPGEPPTPHTVTFDGNNQASGTVPGPMVQETAGEELTLPGNTGNLAKTGFAFIGWNTQADGNGTKYAAGAPYTPSADITLYAHWTDKKFTVTFDGNGKTGGTAPADQVQQTVGQQLTLPAKGTLEKTDYVFIGWNTQADGDGTNYAPSDPYTPIADITLYANWTNKKFTVTFDGNNQASGTAPTAMEQGTPGAQLTIPDNTGTLVKTGYAFGGWNTKADGTGTSYAPAAAYTPSKNITLYAKWITFEISGTITTDETTGPTDLRAVSIKLKNGATDVKTVNPLANGTYTISGVGPGTYSIEVSWTGYKPETLTSVTVSNANVTKNVTLKKYYKISGTCLDKNGASLNGVSIQLQMGDPLANCADAVISADGVYTILNVVNGSYTIVPSKENVTYAGTAITVTVNGADATKNIASTS